MKIGDLVMLRQDLFDDRLLGVLTRQKSSFGWFILWCNGTESYHPERHLEAVCR